MSDLTQSVQVAQNLLKLVDACDNFPNAPSKEYTQAVSEFYLFALLDTWDNTCTSLVTYGYIPQFVVQQMPWPSTFNIDHGAKIISIPFTADRSESEILAEVLNLAREQKSFRVLSGWRDELYPIAGIKGRDVSMERAGSGLFGIASRGAHCIAYKFTPSSTSPGGRELQLIVARRSKTKSTYPLMLDNTIAGGISAGESPWLCFVREASEEAGLSSDIACRAKAVGTISYVHIRDARAGGETGLVQPECQYLWDLELKDAVPEEVPRVNDDEVAGFETMNIQQVWDCLMRDEFKPNCGIVVIDFLIRWGYIRPGRDEGTSQDASGPVVEREGWEIPGTVYAEIASRLHRRLAFEDVQSRLNTSG